MISNEHVRRHAELQSVVEAETSEATELRGRLNDIGLALNADAALKSSAEEVYRSVAGTPTATGLRLLLFWQHVSGVQAPGHYSSEALWGISRH